MIVAVIALVIAATGTAYAALKVNSVGSRQIKAQAVTTAKLADGAVNSEKVAAGSLTGKNINASELGTVPSATNVVNAVNANAVNGHAASCPAATTLIRGTCFDTNPSGPVTGVRTAAEACAAKGGFLPKVEELVATRSVLNLGSGEGVHNEFTDSYFYNTTGTEPVTIVVNSTGQKNVLAEDSKTKEILGTYEYICSYPLVR